MISTAGPASTNLKTDSLCYRQSSSSSNNESDDVEGTNDRDDPTVPLLRQNVYAWYLAVSQIYLYTAKHTLE